MIFLHYEPARKLAEPHFGYSNWYPRKKKYDGTWHATVLQKVPFPAYPLVLALWSDLAGSSHSACPHRDTMQQKC